MRSLRTATQSSLHSPQLEKAHTQQRKLTAAKNKLKKKNETIRLIYLMVAQNITYGVIFVKEKKKKIKI